MYRTRTPSPASALSVRDLLLRSDFGRLHPDRVDELLKRCADPLMEDRTSERSEGQAGHSLETPRHAAE